MNIESKREQHEFKHRRTESEVKGNDYYNKSFVYIFPYRAKQQDKLGIHLSHYGAGFKKYNKGVLGSPPICTSHLGILFFKVFTGGSTDKRSLHFSNSEVSGILWSWFGSEFEDARSYKDRGVSKSTFHVNTQAYWGLFFEVCNGKAGFGDIS